MIFPVDLYGEPVPAIDYSLITPAVVEAIEDYAIQRRYQLPSGLVDELRKIANAKPSERR